jgi:hypothetical protein
MLRLIRLFVHARLLEVAALDDRNRQRADVLLEGCVHLVREGKAGKARQSEMTLTEADVFGTTQTRLH